MSVLPYATLPSFHHVTLPDTSSVEDAVRLVFSARGRAESSTSSASLIASRISSLTGAADVGSLRRLTDGEWRAMELPAMAALYLKHAMRQSSRGTSSLLLSPLANTSSSAFPSSSSAFPSSPASSPVDPVLVELQAEFQLLQPIDIAQYAASLTMLQSMGFTRKESLEALLVTDNKGEDVAVNYLFADPTRRNKQKEDTKKRLIAAAATTASSSSSPTASSRSPSASVPGAGLGTGGSGVERLALYRELVRGVLLDERLTVKSYHGLKAEREKRKVSGAEEKQVLRELGITVERWDNLRRQKSKPVEGATAGGGANEGIELDCVVCLDERKSHVCMPCGHVCLCGGCAQSVVKSRAKGEATCPMCHKKVDDCTRVFL